MPAHPNGCPCEDCAKRRLTRAHTPIAGALSGARRAEALALVTPAGAPIAPRARFALACDCGSEELARHGPYTDAVGPGGSPELGLRWVLVCTRCGEQLRIVQTSPAWRERRWAEAAAPLEARIREHDRSRGCTCSAFDATGALVFAHVDGCPAKAPAPHNGAGGS